MFHIVGMKRHRAANRVAKYTRRNAYRVTLRTRDRSISHLQIDGEISAHVCCRGWLTSLEIL